MGNKFYFSLTKTERIQGVTVETAQTGTIAAGDLWGAMQILDSMFSLAAVSQIEICNLDSEDED